MRRITTLEPGKSPGLFASFEARLYPAPPKLRQSHTGAAKAMPRWRSGYGTLRQPRKVRSRAPVWHAIEVGSCWVSGWCAPLCDQGGDEGAEQGLATTARVVDELEEAEIERQLVLGDAAVRAQPGAQQ